MNIFFYYYFKNRFNPAKAKSLIGALLGLSACVFYFIDPACAAATGTCTSDAAFDINPSVQIVTTIANQISCFLFGTSTGGAMCPASMAAMNVSRMLFNTITNHGAFIEVLQIALTLYIVFYGIAFTVGIVNLTMTDFVGRVVKFGIIIMLASPASWDNYFAPIVVHFFKDGTDWMIKEFSVITMPFIPTGFSPTGPFVVLDIAISHVLSARMFVTLLAAFFSGPYGLILGLIILMSLGTFVSAILQAIWVYLMSLLIKAFLLGLAPFFLCMLLFTKTRHLFDGWLNQLISATLQPVFLFTFFGFFAQLVISAMYNLLYGGDPSDPSINVCYVSSQGLFRGTPHDVVMPRFTRGGLGSAAAPMGWDDHFPLPVYDILIFLLLTQLTWRFNSIVIQIAKEISGAASNLNMGGALSGMMNPGAAFTSGANKAASAASQRMSAARKGADVQQTGRDSTPGVGSR